MVGKAAKSARTASRKLGKKAGTKKKPPATAATRCTAPTREEEAQTAWSLGTPHRHWVPQRTHRARNGATTAADATPDRFDVVGTTGVNELVLRHGTMPSSDLKNSVCPVLFSKASPRRQSTHETRPNTEPTTAASSQGPSPSFSLDRYLSNLVRALVHPLHNFLQCHHRLHNADEVQVMLMPRDGPLAAAEASVEATAHAASFRRCYIATNHETLTEAGLQAAVRGWGVAGVFQISEFVLVRGEKGRHAEQKLLEHLRRRLPAFSAAASRGGHGGRLTADQKALVVGERLPCVTCRLFATFFEDVAVLLPSHGHMYLSTIPLSLNALESSTCIAEEDKAVVRGAYADPAKAARLLLAAQHRRVLR